LSVTTIPASSCQKIDFHEIGVYAIHGDRAVLRRLAVHREGLRREPSSGSPSSYATLNVPTTDCPSDISIGDLQQFAA
jgi:hypothetical protein